MLMNDNNSLEDSYYNITTMNDNDLFDLLDQINYEEEKKYIDSIEEKLDEINICLKCNTADLIVDDVVQGIRVCSGCGEVLDVLLDENPEWRSYHDERGEVARCSNPTNFFLPQSSLGTSIAGAYRSKIRTLHSWNAMPYKERSLNLVLKEIQARCRKANILKCIEDDAKIMYKNISECQHKDGVKKGRNVIIRGSNRRSLIAACVFYACLRKGDTRSPKEMAQIFELEYTDITKGCKTFQKLIKMKQMNCDISSSTPEHFVKRYCRDLKIKGDYALKAIQIAKNIQRLNLASVHTPISVATGSILLMAEMYNLPIQKKTIANKFEVSEVTVIKAYKKLERYKKILVDDKKTEKLLQIMEADRNKQDVPQNLEDSYKNLNETNKEKGFIPKKCRLGIDDIDSYLQEYDDKIKKEMEETEVLIKQMKLFNKSVVVLKK